jgi:hypothetical protein
MQKESGHHACPLLFRFPEIVAIACMLLECMSELPCKISGPRAGTTVKEPANRPPDSPRCWVMACLVAILVAGCSGVRTYPNTLPKNLRVTTQVESRTTAEFDVHRVNAGCELDHQGRVSLDNGVTEVGIPVEETIYLDFIFASKSFLSSTTGVTRYSTLLTPRAGYDYRAEVKYIEGLYGVVIRESRKGGSGGREIDRVPLSACKARSR